MKKLLLMLSLVAGVTLGASAQKKSHGGGFPKQLETKLNLTAEQSSKIKAIAEQKKASMDSLAKDTTLAKKALHKKKAHINQAADQKIDAILNDDQRKAYNAWKDEQKTKHKKAAPAAEGSNG